MAAQIATLSIGVGEQEWAKGPFLHEHGLPLVMVNLVGTRHLVLTPGLLSAP